MIDKIQSKSNSKCNNLDINNINNNNISILSVEKSNIINNNNTLLDCLYSTLNISRQKLTKKEHIILELIRKEFGDKFSDEENNSDKNIELLDYFKSKLIDMYNYYNIKYDENFNLYKKVGFQTNNPLSDFRGGGLLALKFMVYYIDNYRDEFFVNSKVDYLLFAILIINICVSKYN